MTIRKDPIPDQTPLLGSDSRRKQAVNLVAVLLLGAGWGSILLSIALYLLFWRVHYEPGAIDQPGLFWAAFSCCSAGGLVFLAAHLYLLIRQAWSWLGLAWLLCGLILTGALVLSPLLLILLV